LAYVATNASWRDRIEGKFQALRSFTLDGIDHCSHEEQNSMIRLYIIWRNRSAQDKPLHYLTKRANVAWRRRQINLTVNWQHFLSLKGVENGYGISTHERAALTVQQPSPFWSPACRTCAVASTVRARALCSVGEVPLVSRLGALPTTWAPNNELRFSAGRPSFTS
jgi:hypothetical protein